MEITRIEQILISAFLWLSITLAGVFIFIREDVAATWYAWQLVAAAILFAGGYVRWYRSAPRDKARIGKDDPRRGPLAVHLRRARTATRDIRKRLVGAASAALVLGFAATLRPGMPPVVGTLSVVAAALLLGWWSWLHFPAQRRPKVRPTPKVGLSGDSNPLLQHRIDVLKLEYQQAAERYENIYKAVWQNFSYMSVVSAGILTFGQKSLPAPVLTFLAVTPVFFWYLATFLPMDYYGQEVRQTLRRVEHYINTTIGLQLVGHFAKYAEVRFHWRVRDPVRVFGTTLGFLWVTSLAFAAGHVVRRELVRSDDREFESALAAKIRRLEISNPPQDTATLSQLRKVERILSGQPPGKVARQP